MKQLVQVLAVMQFLLINLRKVNIKSTKKKKTSMNVGNWSKNDIWSAYNLFHTTYVMQYHKRKRVYFERFTVVAIKKRLS